METNEAQNNIVRRPGGPRAISRALDLLMLLAGKPQGMALGELSSALSVPKSTFVDTLRGLCELQYLLLDGNKYRLGPSAYHFASRIMLNWSAPDMIRAEVKALAAETGESVGFAIADWELGQAIYTEAENSKQPVRYAMQAGLRAPLYASASGRVLLAFATPQEQETYLARAPLRQLTGQTETDPERIKANLDRIRAQGFCASFGEMLKDTAALAVPVLNPDGRCMGTIMLAAPLDRMRANLDRFLETVIRAGTQASAGRWND